MRLDRTTVSRLRNILCRYLGSLDHIALICQDVGIERSRINLDKSPEVAWQQVLEEADRLGTGPFVRLLQVCEGRAPALAEQPAIAALMAQGNPKPENWIPPAYRDWLERRYLTLSTGLGSSDTRGMRLKQVYVPLHATWTEPQELSKLLKTGEKDRKISRRPLAELLELTDHRHFLVRGGPGSGKSTFLRYSALERLEGSKEPVLPVLLELRDFGVWLGKHEQAGSGPELLLAWAGEMLAPFGLDAHGLGARAGQGRVVWLLDGLDEIFDPTHRERAVNVIGACFCLQPQARDRLLLASREHAVADPCVLAVLGLSKWVADVEPLVPQQQQEFLRRWFGEVYQDDPIRGEEECRKLVDRLRRHPEVQKLTPTPQMLSTIAALHYDRKCLPERRSELYERVITILLERRFGPRVSGGSEEKVRRARNALAAAAKGMMERGAVRELGMLEFRELLSEGWCPDCLGEGRMNLELDDVAHGLGSNSGLLRVTGHPPVYRFSHLAFQEYLAARAIGEQKDPVSKIEGRWDEGGWEETILLIAGYLGCAGPAWMAQEFVEKLLQRRGVPPRLCRRLYLAAQGAAEAPKDVLGEQLLARIGTLAQSALSDSEQPCPVGDRIKLAHSLGQLGDPRLGMEKAGRWVWVPPVVVVMEADETHGIRPPPNQRNSLRGLWLGKYPVTNEEYRGFVEAGGYEEEGQARWWTPEGREAWKVHREAIETGRGQPSTEPAWWGDALWNGPNQPVVGVSWYEAGAYCRWLTERWGNSPPACLPILREKEGLQGPVCLEIRLPSDLEWRWSASGWELREYPWGKEEPTPELANYIESGTRRTTPVGVYPKGCGPFGALDQAGNVWEWTSDRRLKDGHVQLRGGAWYNVPLYLHGSMYDWSQPGDREVYIGFRVVCVLSPRSVAL